MFNHCYPCHCFNRLGGGALRLVHVRVIGHGYCSETFAICPDKPLHHMLSRAAHSVLNDFNRKRRKFTWRLVPSPARSASVARWPTVRDVEWDDVVRDGTTVQQWLESKSCRRAAHIVLQVSAQPRKNQGFKLTDTAYRAARLQFLAWLKEMGHGARAGCRQPPQRSCHKAFGRLAHSIRTCVCNVCSTARRENLQDPALFTASYVAQKWLALAKDPASWTRSFSAWGIRDKQVEQMAKVLTKDKECLPAWQKCEFGTDGKPKVI